MTICCAVFVFEVNMPIPSKDETEKEFIKRCIPFVLDEGTTDDPSQAAAICHGIWDKHQGKAQKAIWITAEQMRELCPSCADKMVARGLTRLNLAEIKIGIKAHTMEDLCSRSDFQFGEPGFFTRCAELVSGYSWVDDPDPFCAALHYACVGTWPGEKAAKAEGEFVFLTLPDIPAAVKALGEWELEVLGVPFGTRDNKDSDGQFFTERTEAYLANYKSIPVFYYHSINPDGKTMQAEPELIGKAEYARTDKQGHWFRVTLDNAKKLARRIWEAAKKGIARASSGSLNYLVRVAQSGEILSWPVAELSLIDIDGGRQPANPLAIATPVIKAAYKQAGLPYPVIPPEEGDNVTPAEKPIGDAEAAQDAAQSEGAKAAVKSKQGEIEMDEKELDVKVQAAVKSALDAKAAEENAKKAEQERVEAEVTKRVDAAKAELAAGRRLPMGDGAPYAAKFADTWKYDHLSPVDLSMVIDVMRTGDEQPAPAAIKALALKVAELKGEDAGYVKGAFKAALGFDPTVEAIKAATDPMYSGGSGIGSDWVGTAYSNELWRMIRAGAQIVAKIPTIIVPDGYSSMYYPLESTDPTWYKVAEATASDATLKVPAATITASQATTATKQITLGKMGARVLYTGELIEDSLIAFVPQLREQIATAGAEQMEHVVIDGDTETAATTNINHIGGTPTSTDLYLLTNGFRKLPLVTTTANSRSGGALDEDDFLETMWLMGTAGMAGADLAKCAFIVDPNVYKAALKMAAIKTQDVWANATLENGVLTRLWGYAVFASWFMHYKSTARKANSAGKVDQTTTANNTLGAILGVRWDQWKLAYKRRMTMEVTRIANADAWEIVALARWGLAYRDGEASAISYNITI